MSVNLEGEWNDQPDDPDLESDLGYDIATWDVVPVTSGEKEHRVLLPTDEEMLKQDSYMIVPASLVLSLEHEC